MRLTQTLYGEHGAIYAMMDALESLGEKADLTTLLAAARLFERALLDHAAMEDEMLFARLEPMMPGGGPLRVMRFEHEEIERGLAEVGRSTDVDEANARLGATFGTIRDHFRKEEMVLFPMAEQLLSSESLEALGADWAERRGVSLPAA